VAGGTRRRNTPNGTSAPRLGRGLSAAFPRGRLAYQTGGEYRSAKGALALKAALGGLVQDVEEKKPLAPTGADAQLSLFS
jgi:hypothetical protein